MKIYFRFLFFLLLAQGFNANSQSKKGVFRDSVDNAFDISNYLLNLNGLLPVVAPITEPALGIGAALAMVYFIPKDEKNKGFQMPDMVVGAGGYTSNGTWFAGGGYIGFWKNDHLRYRGFGGYGDITMKYYGKGDTEQANNPIEFNALNYFFLQQTISRIRDTNFFIGGKYQLTKTEIISKGLLDNPNIDARDLNTYNSGVAIILEFENYNNILSPTKGVMVHLDYDQNLEIIGSDRNYGRLSFFSHMFFPVNKFWVPAFRIESLVATGGVPFYALPFVSLRGVPMLRYQGDLTILVETEHSFNLSERWGLVGFGGVGTSFNYSKDLTQGENAWNIGTGFRYKAARLLGLKMGIDIARCPEQWAGYVVFGHSWLR
jgi:hypothetical protein